MKDSKTIGPSKRIYIYESEVKLMRYVEILNLHSERKRLRREAVREIGLFVYRRNDVQYIVTII